MKVLIDTPIWSLAFRKKNISDNNITIECLINLIRNGRVAIIGPIRQEVLSGISDRNKFNEIKDKMSIFPDYDIQTSDYEFAVECSNECRRNGIQGSHTDFLICAIAIRNGWEIFTEDHDFSEYGKYIPIKIYNITIFKVKQPFPLTINKSRHVRKPLSLSPERAESFIAKSTFIADCDIFNARIF